MNLDNHLELALELKNFGFNLMPIPPPKSDGKGGFEPDGKTPYKKIPWRNFVSQPLTKAILTEHFTAFPNDSIAILTGTASNLCVIDLDRHDATDAEVNQTLELILSLFEPTHLPPIALTGGGGIHFYVAQAGIKNTIGIPIAQVFPNELKTSTITLDLKSDGGYIIAPPSYHRSGKQYIWHPNYPLDRSSFPLPRLPTALQNLASDRSRPRTAEDWRQLTQVTLQGNRHANAVSMAGLLLLRLRPEEWESIGYPLLQSWNKTAVNPPLDEKELRSVFTSIANKEYEKYKL